MGDVIGMLEPDADEKPTVRGLREARYLREQPPARGAAAARELSERHRLLRDATPEAHTG
jgi:hypothetical protein